MAALRDLIKGVIDRRIASGLPIDRERLAETVRGHIPRPARDEYEWYWLACEDFAIERILDEELRPRGLR